MRNVFRLPRRALFCLLLVLGFSSIGRAGHVEAGDLLKLRCIHSWTDHHGGPVQKTEGEIFIRVTQGCDPDSAPAGSQCRSAGNFGYEILQASPGCPFKGTLYVKTNIDATMQRCGLATPWNGNEVVDQVQTVRFNDRSVIACAGLPNKWKRDTIYTPESPTNWIQQTYVFPSDYGGYQFIFELLGFSRSN